MFKFSSLQSEFGQSILEKNGFPKTELDSFIFLSEGKIHQKSSAGLQVAKKLGGFWRLLYVLIIIPKPFRNWIYSVVAKNRYRWFGKQESCWLPSPELKSRFI